MVKVADLRVEEIMIPLEDYPHIHDDQTLGEAIKLFEEANIKASGKTSLPRTLLVFDRADKMIGIVRRRDVMRGLEPGFLVNKPLKHRKKLFDVQLDPHLTEMNIESILSGLKQRSKGLVREVMRQTSITIGHNDHIGKAIYEMVDENISLLPVIKEGRVIGVLRSVDVFHQVARVVLNDQ